MESFDAISLLLYPSLIADTISLSREVNPEAAPGCFSNRARRSALTHRSPSQTARILFSNCSGGEALSTMPRAPSFQAQVTSKLSMAAVSRIVCTGGWSFDNSRTPPFLGTGAWQDPITVRQA